MAADAELDHSLDRLRAALRRGDLAELALAATAIEAQLTALDQPPDEAILHRLRGKAERNLKLLEAAARGLRAARHRLQEIAAGGRGLSTYDMRGQRADLGAGGSIGRRV